MIFVTVGTSDFDLLVQKMDQVASSLDDEVLIQIGYGQYIPQNCEYFRFAPSLEPYYDRADIVVAQGGVATIIEVLTKGKTLISVENTTCVDSHQTEILSAFAEENFLIWCRDLEALPSLLEQAPTVELKSYAAPPCTIGDMIRDFLQELT